MKLDEKLDKWIETKKNVLLIGKKGCGKTTRAIEALERNNIKYKYFSTPTLDAWIDFVGIPKEKNCEDGRVIEFITPQWHNEDIECIILDEYNRGHAKVRSACLELIQLKSINGVKFPNLKMVWGCINECDDEEYNVEQLDPAEKDRFHVHFNVRYEPDKDYFYSKYGDNGLKAINWWNDLSTSIKNLVSPRRLDYALEFFSQNGDINDVLSPVSNPEKLLKMLSMENIIKVLDNLRFEDEQKIKNWFVDPTNLEMSINTVLSNDVYIQDFALHLPKEKLSNLITVNSKVRAFVLSKYLDSASIQEILKEIIEANANINICKEISKEIAKLKLAKGPLDFGDNSTKAFKTDFSSSSQYEFDGIINAESKTYYSSSQKEHDIVSLLNNVPDDLDKLKLAVDKIEKIATNTIDATFTKEKSWITLLNTYLMKKDNSENTTTQKFLSKKYPYLFAKINRCCLEKLVWEIKK